jgi:uncharacterized oxidoreductase
MNLAGNMVLVTGGGAGIGRALAEAFARAGSEVILVDKDADELESARKLRPEFITYTCDVSRSSERRQLVSTIGERHPGLNVLINNAGVHYNYRFTDGGDFTDRIEHEVGTNLIATIDLSGLLVPLLRQKRVAAVVNLSSGLAFVPKESSAVYCATKAGVHLFTRTLRRQLANTSVKVFELLPPLVDTGMTRGRGGGKMSPEELARRFSEGFEADRYEMSVGSVRTLRVLHRIHPALAERTIEKD